MRRFICPRCKRDSISLKDKYLAGIWMTISCRECGARLCGHPWAMALGYIPYVWALAWFAMWALLDGSWLPILYLIPVWLLLDALNILFMPLASLRPGSRGQGS
jgi:hypothetical protein